MRRLREIADYYEAGTIDALVEERGLLSIVNAIGRATEFEDIWVGLRNSNDPQLRERLKTFVGGVILLSDETTDGNRPRNIGFELSIAATASSAGLPIDLRPPADLTIPISPHPFFVECTRPLKEGKVQHRIRRGLNQLVRRYAASDQPERARGILAICISKTENDGSSWLQASNESELATQIKGILDRYVARYRHYWEERADPRTLSVMLELRALCRLEDPSLLVVVRQFVFVMLCDPGSPDRQAFDAIARPFQALNTGAPFL